MENNAPAVASSLIERAVRGARLHLSDKGLAELILALHEACDADDRTFSAVLKSLDRFPAAIARVAPVSQTLENRALDCIVGSPIEDAQVPATQRMVRSIRIRAANSLTALRSFLVEGKLPELAVALVVRIDRIENGPVLGDIEVRSLSYTAGWFVWDRFSVTGESLAGIALALHGVAQKIICEIKPRPALFTPGPMFKFHPERFKDARHYAQRARQFHRSGGLPTLETFGSVMNLVTSEMNERLSEFTRRDKLIREVHAMTILDAEEALVMAWLKYMGAGKQIFDIPQHMSEMLRSTDADDIPVSLIRTPYSCLFINFGSQVDLEISPGWLIDGCYVEHHSEVPLLSFTFTACPENPGKMAEWHSFGEPVETISFEKEAFALNLGAAIDYAVAKKINQLRHESTEGDEIIRKGIDIATVENIVPEGARVQSVSRVRAVQQLSVLEQRRFTVHGALQLAVNALCYLTAYPEDITEEWPEGTPEALRRNAELIPQNKRKRASQELARLGYTKVKICGNALRRSNTTTGVTGQTRTHWRRGHWRRQVHGEGRAQRKLIWLMPTLVNAGLGEGDGIGHIYSVE
jgi:hypothetical protein